tara:strand:+ start:427 stop:1953 length:1527 start_codon:yes stop_codon:yes gene_type:complete
MKLTGKNYIGGELSSKGNSTYKTFNPNLNSENNISFYEANIEEIENAIDLASVSFKAYQKISDENKAIFLDEIANQIDNLGEQLIKLYTEETGLPSGRAENEKIRTINQIKSFSNLLREENWKENHIDHADSTRKPIPKPEIIKTYYPIGPVVVFTPSNFPLAFSTAGSDTISALAAGCPVIVKSHPMHSGTGELISYAINNAILKTKMPNGIFSNLNGKKNIVGEFLVKHPKISGVGFTGSTKGGRALLNIANNRSNPIPVFAEMGSINPVVIMEGILESDNKKLIDQIASSILLGAGQFCTNPGLIIIKDSIYADIFIKELSLKLDDSSEQCMLHPNILKNFIEKSDYVEKLEGVKKITDNKVFENNFVMPQICTLSSDNFLKDQKFQTEVFGPFSLIVKCKTYDDIIEVISNLEGQLTGTIMANIDDKDFLKNIISALEVKVGRIIFNGVPTGVEVCKGMNHGGPYPASSNARYTSVGIDSIKRWIRPISYQNWPQNIVENNFNY